MSKLTTSDGAQGDHFGKSVAVSGTTVVVGASGEDDKGVNSGAAYVFDCSSYPCVQVSKLTASDGAKLDWFGKSVAMSGTMAVVGAFGVHNPRDFSGAAYVFDFDLIGD